MSGRCRESLQDVRKWSVGRLECPGVVGMPPRMSISGREDLPDVPEWSGGPSKYLGVVVRPSRMSRSGGRPLRISGSGRKTL